MKALCKDGIHHTEYYIVKDEERAEAYPIPQENFDLTSEEHQRQIRSQLELYGLTLVIAK